MDLSVVPLHKNKKYMEECCNLINDEWKRSTTARMRSLECSSDKLPTSLILLYNKKVIGHLKLSSIPNTPNACFVESVVIDRKLRGQGFGTYLMKEAERYCEQYLLLKTIYLSTKGQEHFYRKLGYIECAPISIYGNYNPKIITNNIQTVQVTCTTAPPPPPLPNNKDTTNNIKTYMMKVL